MWPFNTGITVEVDKLRDYLVANPELFDKYNMRRTAPGSPHKEMTDIWVRYRDPTPFIASGDWSTFGDEHDSVWYPEFVNLPQVREICHKLMHVMRGTRLGGVLITKLPTGGEIVMHTDNGWHARYYEKLYVPIQNSRGAEMRFKDLRPNEEKHDQFAVCPKDGEVWWFDNSEQHGVVNHSNEDRLAMIVCIRRS